MASLSRLIQAAIVKAIRDYVQANRIYPERLYTLPQILGSLTDAELLCEVSARNLDNDGCDPYG